MRYSGDSRSITCGFQAMTINGLVSVSLLAVRIDPNAKLLNVPTLEESRISDIQLGRCLRAYGLIRKFSHVL